MASTLPASTRPRPSRHNYVAQRLEGSTRNVKTRTRHSRSPCPGQSTARIARISRRPGALPDGYDALGVSRSQRDGKKRLRGGGHSNPRNAWERLLKENTGASRRDSRCKQLGPSPEPGTTHTRLRLPRPADYDPYTPPSNTSLKILGPALSWTQRHGAHR